MEKDLDILLFEYLENQLAPEEKAALEKRIQSEPAVASAFEEALLTYQAVQAKGDQQLKEKLMARPAPEGAKPSRVIRPLWIAAAAACLLILFGLFLWLRPAGQPNWQILASAEFEVPPVGTQSRNNPEMPLLRQKGTDAYIHEKYPQAIPSWRSYLQDTLDHDIQFSLGIAYWQTSQSDSAAYYLDQIPSTHALYQRALWYQVAVCIQENDNNCLKSSLEKVVQHPGHYKEMLAREWLDELTE